MEPRHIFSIYVYYNPQKPGPYNYGGLIYDHLPIHILSAVSDADAYQQALELGIKYRMCRYIHITGRTAEDAEIIIMRIKKLIGTVEDGTGPLLSLSDLFDKQLGQNHTGIKKKTKFNRRKWAVGNDFANKAWIVRNHLTGQSSFVHGLERWIKDNQLELDSSNLRKTCDGTRRVHKGFSVIRGDFFNWD